MGGKPVIRGTRVPVETMLRKLGAGMTTDAILIDHPRLTHDDFLPPNPLPPITWPTKISFMASRALAYR
jgi:hypothetical protein